MDGDFVLDGEIVALDEGPLFSSSRTGERFHSLRTCMPSTLLIWDSDALHTQTIERRQEQLRELLPESIDPIRLSLLLLAPVDQVLEGCERESLTVKKMKECRRVKPKLVCQIAFIERTNAGHRRHCIFIALR
jgi:ATP-dependent DNA ligase